MRKKKVRLGQHCPNIYSMIPKVFLLCLCLRAGKTQLSSLWARQPGSDPGQKLESWVCPWSLSPPQEGASPGNISVGVQGAGLCLQKRLQKYPPPHLLFYKCEVESSPSFCIWIGAGQALTTRMQEKCDCQDGAVGELGSSLSLRSPEHHIKTHLGRESSS